jgi:hypothetical protein
MADSILDTIKKMLGIPTTDTAFDTDIIVNINSAFMVLNQIGVGPETVYTIEDSSATWADFITDMDQLYSAVKTYIYLKVKVVFDPPGTSYLLDAVQNQILELESRLLYQVPIETEPAIPPEEP